MLFSDLCNTNDLFGNKVIVLSGDFRQTLPIVKDGYNTGSKEDILRNCLKNSWIWDKVIIKRLHENLRLKSDHQNNFDFAKYLLDIGEDKLEKNEDEEIVIRSQFIYKDNNLFDFLNLFFKESEFYEGNLSYYKNTAILAPLNKDVHELNDKILDSFRSKNEKTYLSYDRIIDECKEMHISEEILNNIVQSGLPLYKLRLKTGSIVIC